MSKQTWTFGAGGLTLSNSVITETHTHGGVQTGSGNTGPPM